ncbi:MAG: sigma-70 family RNA polymerase sigma factor [Cyanobacteria bacterium SZAS LIN-3]|nr:sigma-70 family RNA polymerase sigma factor [Cyanobacteria bacterium SZAS LIN-3]MBS2005632.1 sigma-70 family RNA polymerase sigma factor [Cyanobacteria bacterium SZAS TMP-1]
MDFTPQRMMRYIRSRARLATDEDIEDILQNALVLVTLHFDPSHPDAKLAPYCLGACNKAIAQNLERYHKVALKRRSDKDKEKEADAGKDEAAGDDVVELEEGGEDSIKGSGADGKKGALSSIDSVREAELDGTRVVVKTIKPGKAFDDKPSTTSQYRTTSLDSMFDEEDGRSADDFFGPDSNVVASGGGGHDPASKALINDLIEQIMKELPTELHRTCFVLKYVEGYKREDLIECLKMDAKSIDTIDKKIVRTLKAFKDKMDQDEARS